MARTPSGSDEVARMKAVQQAFRTLVSEKHWLQVAVRAAFWDDLKLVHPDRVVSDKWLPPIPLRTRACSFPIQDAFPPGTERLRDYIIAVAEAFQVPPDLPAMLVPASVGLAVSHAVVVRLGSEWTQPPNHYNACLMEPGNRKTGPFHEVCQPVLQWEREQCERLAPQIAAYTTESDIMRRRCERLKDLAAGKVNARGEEPTGRGAENAAIEMQKELALRKSIVAPQLIASDTTPEEMVNLLIGNGERVGVMSDESEAVDVFMGRYDDKPNVQLYNKGYDGSPHRVNRVGRSSAILQNPRTGCSAIASWTGRGCHPSGSLTFRPAQATSRLPTIPTRSGGSRRRGPAFTSQPTTLMTPKGGLTRRRCRRGVSRRCITPSLRTAAW